MSGEIIFATSFDEKHSPSNIFSSNNSDFWSSTGMYPQELVISFPQPKQISELNIVGYNIKSLLIESCENDSAVIFNPQSEIKNIPLNEGSLQEISCKFTSKGNNKIVKINILDGHKLFCTINSINFK